MAATLEEDVAAAFARACRERDMELAEFLFQAIEAIAKREGREGRVEEAFAQLLRTLPGCSPH